VSHAAHKQVRACSQLLIPITIQENPRKTKKFQELDKTQVAWKILSSGGTIRKHYNDTLTVTLKQTKN